MTQPIVTAETRIRAPTERVWAAWAEPQRLASWFVDEARGRIGQDPRITWIWEQFGLEVESEVTEVDPGRRFVLRVGGPDGVRSTEILLVEGDADSTKIRVTERGFGIDPDVVRSGWEMALAVLKVYAEDYWGRSLRSVLVMAETASDPSRILSMFQSAQGLAAWLGDGGPMPAEGESVDLRHGSGLAVTGRVLRHTGLETSLRWHEIDGILELKQFPGPEGRIVALRAFSWADPGVDPVHLRALLSDALDRLTGALG